MRLKTMTHPIGYYTGYNPQTQKPDTLHQLSERFGSHFQGMSYEQKIVMRAALAGFIAEKPVWQEDSYISCIDGCIESAGVDWRIWDEDPELVKHIQACSQLDESDIEGLIEALTAQIRGKLYASRTEEWEVITP
jgi:hypothetical protein